MVKLLQPQEIEVFYIIPALRRELARHMKEDGKAQKDIAKLLGVTEPAVSQYFSSKRAAQIKFKAALKAEIKTAARLITNETSLFHEVQRLLQLARQERVICQAHELYGGAPKNCNTCFEDEEQTIQIKGPV